MVHISRIIVIYISMIHLKQAIHHGMNNQIVAPCVPTTQTIRQPPPIICSLIFDDRARGVRTSSICKVTGHLMPCPPSCKIRISTISKHAFYQDVPIAEMCKLLFFATYTTYLKDDEYLSIKSFSMTLQVRDNLFFPKMDSIRTRVISSTELKSLLLSSTFHFHPPPTLCSSYS